MRERESRRSEELKKHSQMQKQDSQSDEDKYRPLLSVRLCPINVKTVQPIGPKVCIGPHVTPGKVYELSKLKNMWLQVFIFVKILKS